MLQWQFDGFLIISLNMEEVCVFLNQFHFLFVSQQKQCFFITLDPSQIFLSSHSAGGHLAATLVCDEQWLQEVNLTRSVIRGVISISGIYYVENPMSTLILEEDQSSQVCVSTVVDSIKSSFWRNVGKSFKMLEKKKKKS